MQGVNLQVFLSGDAVIDIDGTVFIQFAIFAVLFFVLKTWLFAPLMAMFDKRKAETEGKRERAFSIEHTLAEQQAKYDAEVARVKALASKEQEALRAEAAQLERSLLEKVRADMHRILEDSRQRLKDQGATVRGELSHHAQELAQQVATKVLGRAGG